MKKLLSATACLLMLGALPAQAQLSPVYGDLRHALENTMAQSMPPGSRQSQSSDSTGDAGKDNSSTNSSAQTQSQPKDQDQGR